MGASSKAPRAVPGFDRLLQHAQQLNTSTCLGGKRTAPRPNMIKDFKIISLNAEGITPTKCDILSDLQADILCIQETHKDTAPPTIHVMHLIIHFPHLKHGSAIYARDKSVITSSQD